MHINTFILGDFETNCYVVRSSEEARDCWIIDLGYNPESLITFLQQENLQPQGILLTHGHCDHIAGIKEFKHHFDQVPVSISPTDAEMLTKGSKNLSLMMGQPLKLDPADELLNPGETLDLDQIKLQILPTPGHTPGSISLYCTSWKTVFTGDALFSGSIGRTDFPGGSMKTLLKSIREQLLILPEDTRVLSGHGPETTIGNEKQANPFIQ